MATDSGLDKNTASALSYVLGPITGVIFLITDKRPEVRFHAMQSTIVFFGLFVFQLVMGITIVLAALVPLVSLFGFILWLVLIYKAWQGEDWEVPVVSEYAKKWLKKV